MGDRLQIRARVGTTGVAAGELLFPGAKIPVGQSNRPDINNCAAPKLEAAKTSCKAKEQKFIPSMSCLIDVCFGGDGFAATDGAEGMWSNYLLPDHSNIKCVVAARTCL